MIASRPLKFIKDLLILQDKPSRLKEHIPPGIKDRLKLYKYNLWLLYTDLQRHRHRGLLGVLRHLIAKHKRILFFPDLPWQNAVIYQVCLENDYRIARYPCRRFDLAVKWKNQTVYQPDPVLYKIASTHRVINLDCNDISKAHVDALFQEVFGYGLTVDPTAYHGKCVEKSIFNGRHDGSIIDCPVDHMKDGYVYQMLVDNRSDEAHVMDMRVPVFNGCIPFVMVFYKPVERRFANFHFEGENYQYIDVERLFSTQEQAHILQFCRRLGLECGELDILRHQPDGRIYIVDANNTPDGPPIAVGLEGDDLRRETLRLRAEAFAEAFGLD